jgi:hypothetical protein
LRASTAVHDQLETPSAIPLKPASTIAEIRSWAVKRFCDEADISLAMFYKLEPHQRPTSVKVGSKRVVIESPAAWLSRMGAEAAAEGHR